MSVAAPRSAAPRPTTPRGRSVRRLGVGLAFLAPNIVGFLAFTLVPLVISLAMAFTNWDLRLHNQFKDEPLRFVGFANFFRLLGEPDFWRFFGNTLVLMLGIPVSIAGSLGLALLLNRDLDAAAPRAKRAVRVGAIVASGIVLPVAWLVGGGTGGLLAALACGTLLAGLFAGATFYRTVYYLPHFTAGVATILLWKNLLNPQIGPINAALAPVLMAVANVVNALPAALVRGGLWACALLLAWVVWAVANRWRRARLDGDLGWQGLLAGGAFALLPLIWIRSYWPLEASIVVWIVAASATVRVLWVPRVVLNPCPPSDDGSGHGLSTTRGTQTVVDRRFAAPGDEGLGGALLAGAGVCALSFALLGLGALCLALPTMAADGLAPPGWHTDFHWAKPSIILIGVWAAIGSNNMLLFLAALSSVPAELYEAADLDGAKPRHRFWHVTWPQLAPTTFFIVVMSVIGGLQGGFEMARTLTRGGPDGATTTLSYFIYDEGFITGRLGFSSAVAWTLFLMVMLVTAFNWKFGGRYANE